MVCFRSAYFPKKFTLASSMN